MYCLFVLIFFSFYFIFISIQRWCAACHFSLVPHVVYRLNSEWLLVNYRLADLIFVSASSSQMYNRIDDSMYGTKFCNNKKNKIIIIYMNFSMQYFSFFESYLLIKFLYEIGRGQGRGHIFEKIVFYFTYFVLTNITKLWQYCTRNVRIIHTRIYVEAVLDNSGVIDFRHGIFMTKCETFSIIYTVRYIYIINPTCTCIVYNILSFV